MLGLQILKLNTGQTIPSYLDIVLCQALNSIFWIIKISGSVKQLTWKDTQNVYDGVENLFIFCYYVNSKYSSLSNTVAAACLWDWLRRQSEFGFAMVSLEGTFWELSHSLLAAMLLIGGECPSLKTPKAPMCLGMLFACFDFCCEGSPMGPLNRLDRLTLSLVILLVMAPPAEKS